MDNSIFTKDSARRNVGNHLPARKTRSLTKQRNLEIVEDLKEEEPVENVTFSRSMCKIRFFITSLLENETIPSISRVQMFNLMK